jgi:MtrB/PioB family decaheme-associated outer membrane protein
MIGRVITLAVICSVALFASPVRAQDTSLEGSVGVTAKTYNVHGNKAKFFEYSEKTGGAVYGDVDVKYDSSSYFANLIATDPGYDTQHYRFETGAYGKFKVWLDYNEILHNLSYHNRTFYSGAGSASLVGTPGNNAVHGFNYHTQREKLDTGINFTLAKPFFFNVAYMNEDKDGIRPVGVSAENATGLSLELPVPVRYTSNGFKAQGGYAKNPFFLSFSYTYGQFRNGIEDLHFEALPGWQPGPLSLPPDNNFYQYAFKGSVNLPVNSKFSASLCEGRTDSEADSLTAFDGDVETHSYDVSFTTSPLRFLDGKLYYKYNERNNRSTGSVLISATPVPINPLYYKTNDYGIEAGLRLPLNFYVNTGYRFVSTDRKIKNETDPALALPYNEDNIFFADVRWTGLDYLTAKGSYEGLSRNADYRTNESRAAFNRQFAYAAQKRDTVKASVDISPNDAWNIGAEYRLKRSNYDHTVWGFTDDTKNGYGLTGGYFFRKAVKLSGYFDYEHVILNQRALVSASPWESEQKEITYGYGVQADFCVIPKKLSFTAKYDYLRANGTNDFSFFDSSIWGAIGVSEGSPVDISAWDDYQKYTASFAAVYIMSEVISMRLGYAYARLKFSDSQINGYQYAVAGGSSGAYLTGAYASPSYSANIVFLSLTYQFK